MSDVNKIQSLAILQYSARYRIITRDTESFTLLKAKSIRYDCQIYRFNPSLFMKLGLYD